jgi:hypothetical protein
MAKLTLDDIQGGYASNSKHNSNYDAIETAFENTLSRDGTGPNQMGADLDMNGHGVLNASGVYVNGVDIIAQMETIYNNYVALTTNITISTLSPSGGSDGDIWFKVSV